VALHVSASAPSAQLREVQVDMAAAAKDGARRRAWEAHAAAAGAVLMGQNTGQEGTASDPAQKRLLAQRPGRGLGALGFGALAQAGTPSTRTHGRSGAREAQGPLGSGESGAATCQ
jgi:hypothetical protein